MLRMATKAYKLYFRTTAEFRGIKDLLKGHLRTNKRISERPKATSQDALINAILLWAVDQTPDELAEKIDPYLKRYEQAWDKLLKGEGAEPEIVNKPDRVVQDRSAEIQRRKKRPG